jgi:ankyrin repeat protein
MREFFEAIKGGRVDEVRALLQRDPSLRAARDAGGVSAILLSVYHGKPDVARVCVEMGAPLDIFEASALGRVDRIAALLREDPARVSAYSPDGFYPLGLAAFFGHLEAVRALLAAGADVHAVARNAFKVQPIHAAAASKNLDIVRAVLEAGGDPNVPQQQGFVPLHEAANNGNREMAELLMTHGADPHQKGDAGKSSIDLARDKGHTALAEWMIGAWPPKSPSGDG